MLTFALVGLALASGLSFFTYGYTTITTARARDEYRRYGIPRLRVLNGTLQMFGAGGVLLGLAVPLLGAAAAFGLCLQMLLALNTRRRLRDPWSARVPAATLAAINAALCAMFLLS